MALPPTLSLPTAPRGIRILVIDDEESIRRALSRLLSRDGYAVETAANGRLGLERVQAADFDLILCDCHMPELDGLGFYQALQDTTPERCRGVIFLTGDVLSPEIETFLNQIHALRLHKPFHATDCRQIVYQVLQGLNRTDDSPGDQG